jgi:hypothetical protein
MKIFKKRVEVVSYLLEMDSYTAIQLADVLLKATRHHYLRITEGAEFLTPQEIAVAQPLLDQLRKHINTPVDVGQTVEAMQKRCSACGGVILAGLVNYKAGIYHQGCAPANAR